MSKSSAFIKKTIFALYSLVHHAMSLAINTSLIMSQRFEELPAVALLKLTE